MESGASPAVSVVIPTFNGASRVGDVLVALAAQVPESPPFEVVVVDNASTDGTHEAVQRHPAWGQLQQRGVTCRVVREDRKGLLFARLCGVREAAAPLLVFLDDDNVPSPGYVRAGVEAMAAPDVGVLTSRVLPRYAKPVPPSIAKRAHLLAINQDLGSLDLDWGAGASIAPTIGAGMWLRKSAFLQAVPWQQPEKLMTDRIGHQMVSAGDIEIGFLLGRAGFRRLYVARLTLHHLIPEGRLQSAYFRRLIVGVVRSELTLKEKYGLKRHGPRERLKAGLELLAGGLAMPVLMLRKDPLREWLFALTARYAALLGPLPTGR